MPASSEGLLSVFDLFVHDAVVEVAEAHSSIELTGFLLFPCPDRSQLFLGFLLFSLKNLQLLLADVIDIRQCAPNFTACVVFHVVHDFLSFIKCQLGTVCDHAGPLRGLAFRLEHVLPPLLHLAHSCLKQLFIFYVELGFLDAALGSSGVGLQSFTAQKRLVGRGREAASVMLLGAAHIKLRQVHWIIV